MGASGWSYFVPYQPDISQALQDLREKVFVEGDYLLPVSEDSFRLQQEEWRPELEFYKQNDPETYLLMLEDMKPLLELDPSQPPKTIEEAVTLTFTEGTHSILDIVLGISPTPEVGAVSPLSERTTEAIFGTVKPTRAMIEVVEHGNFDRIIAPCDRGEGIYLMVYKNGQPDEIYFAGISGD